MKAVFKYAVRVYHLQNPMDGIVMPKKQKPDIRLLTADEQAKLEQYIVDNLNLTTYQMSGIIREEIEGETEEYAFDPNLFFCCQDKWRT